MTTTERPTVLKARSKVLMNHLKMVAEDLKDDGFTETARDYNAAAACINQLLKLLED